MRTTSECKCESSFTCGYCLRQVAYFFTPRTWQEILRDQMEAKVPESKPEVQPTRGD